MAIVRKSALTSIAILLALAAVFLFLRRATRVAPPRAMKTPPASGAPVPDTELRKQRAREPERRAPAGLSMAEKTARVERIKRDYEEIRAKAAADYSAAGANFPGGLNAFLRQLALLEREKRADFAAVLTPRELEDLELRETNAGQLAQRLLGNTSATDEQRRAVFRLQRDFDDRFALTFDTSPPALLEREKARQALARSISTVLASGAGDLFAAWDEDFARAREFAMRQGLPPGVAWQLWELKNEFTVRRLDLVTGSDLPAEQLKLAQNNLVRDFEQRALTLVGPGPLQAGRNEVFGWLPVAR